MIHRTNLGFDPDESGLQQNDILENIMNDGLMNSGHLNDNGAYDKKPLLTSTLSPLTGLSGVINLISSYKDNDVTIIVAFPKRIVNAEGNIINQSDYSVVYDVSKYPPKVKPEYIVGAILKKKNGLDEFYSREEIIEGLNKEL
jgi:hypothetical protein